MVHGGRIVLTSCGPLSGAWGGDGLKRAVENLIANAVKYGSAQRPITVSVNSTAEAVTIAVHNEGPVLNKDDIPRLFENFARAQRTQAGVQGWGLGLTVVKGVVEAHEGQIRVESQEGQGTSFILEIPRGPNG